MSDYRENDVFRWHWLQVEADQKFMPYHCKSCIAIADSKGRLIDTYWHSSSSNAVINPADVELDFLGNLDDYEPISSNAMSRYDDSDIMDLRHANSTRGPVFLRKGARLSREKMRSVIEQKLANAMQERNSAQLQIDFLEAQLLNFDHTPTDEIYP